MGERAYTERSHFPLPPCHPPPTPHHPTTFKAPTRTIPTTTEQTTETAPVTLSLAPSPPPLLPHALHLHAGDWALGISAPNDGVALLDVFGPMSAMFPAGHKFLDLAQALESRKEPITHVVDLKSKISQHELIVACREAKLQKSTYLTIAKVLDPNGTFKFYQLPGTKRKAGGNGSNGHELNALSRQNLALTTTIPPLDFSIWRWPIMVLQNVPLKGEKANLEDHDVATLFDNAWCVSQVICDCITQDQHGLNPTLKQLPSYLYLLYRILACR